ncbi:UNVERIFIED_CONTAM: protein SRG1 [Sesamum latifolium]|uniref:Protein SRG1 n=1 Tax=Sesamum latifolium TaxID=2727402 RepID=A0AAW2VCH3_9LAMI
MVLFDNQPLDWVDRLYLLVHPQDQQKLKYWPENPVSFRDMLYDYTARLRQVQEQLLKSMARSLSLAEESFAIRFGERPSMYARFNYYPPCARPDLVVGLKPHADGSGITILLQDEQVEGLQLLKDKQWFRVPIMPYALLVNIGDQLESAYKLDEGEEHIGYVFAPDPAKEIGPVEELVDERRPRAFKKIKNYVESYFHYYQQEKRPIDAVRI